MCSVVGPECERQLVITCIPNHKEIEIDLRQTLDAAKLGMMINNFIHALFGLLLCCLMTPGPSKDIRVMCDHTFYKLATRQIRHHATHNVGCSLNDVSLLILHIWSLQSSSGLCVGMCGLTYSLYHPRGVHALLNPLTLKVLNF